MKKNIFLHEKKYFLSWKNLEFEDFLGEEKPWIYFI